MIDLHEARALAIGAHAGQVDKAGRAYIRHLEAVADLVPPEHEWLALLHDLFEDTKVTPDVLRREFCMSAKSIADICLLTRQPDQTYTEFIERMVIEADNEVLLVKLADVTDHLRPGSENVLTPRHIGRYRSAWLMLNLSLERAGVTMTSAQVEANKRIGRLMTEGAL